MAVIYVNNSIVLEYQIQDASGNAVNITGAASLNIHMIKPDETTLVRAASVKVGTTDTATYSAPKNELDQRGQWRIFVELQKPGTFDGFFGVDQLSVESVA